MSIEVKETSIVAETTLSKSVTINVAENGTMDLEYSGDVKLYEILGMLVTAMADLYTKNFIVPYMNQQSVKIVDHLKSDPIKIDGDNLAKNSKDISELNSGLKNIMNLVDSFKASQKDIGV